jgi:hypothetical protein
MVERGVPQMLIDCIKDKFREIRVRHLAVGALRNISILRISFSLSLSFPLSFSFFHSLILTLTLSLCVILNPIDFGFILLAQNKLLLLKLGIMPPLVELLRNPNGIVQYAVIGCIKSLLSAGGNQFNFNQKLLFVHSFNRIESNRIESNQIKI